MENKLSEVFKYCPNCKNNLIKKEERLVHCDNCGFHYYWNASPATGAVLENEKGEILLVERKFDPMKGYWDLPGGFIEDNESFERGLSRELMEELGIEISEFKYIGSTSDEYRFNGLIYHTIAVLFAGKINSKVKAADDIAAYKFFKKESFPKDKFCFPGLSALIENYLKKNK